MATCSLCSQWLPSVVSRGYLAVSTGALEVVKAHKKCSSLTLTIELLEVRHFTMVHHSDTSSNTSPCMELLEVGHITTVLPEEPLHGGVQDRL